MGASTESQRRIMALDKALEKMKSSTKQACTCCEQLTKRARQLDSLTSPASDASSMLSKAANNLSSTLILMKDAREKFDTIPVCEPAILRLKRGVQQLQIRWKLSGMPLTSFRITRIGEVLVSPLE